MRINEKKVKRWLELFNLTLKKGFHASRHANGAELLDMIRKINPEKLYPVHTDHVTSFDVLKDDGIDVIRPILTRTTIKNEL
jgi:ribonuclease J